MNFFDRSSDVTGDKDGCFVSLQFADLGIHLNGVTDGDKNLKDIS